MRPPPDPSSSPLPGSAASCRRSRSSTRAGRWCSSSARKVWRRWTRPRRLYDRPRRLCRRRFPLRGGRRRLACHHRRRQRSHRIGGVCRHHRLPRGRSRGRRRDLAGRRNRRCRRCERRHDRERRHDALDGPRGRGATASLQAMSSQGAIPMGRRSPAAPPPSSSSRSAPLLRATRRSPGLSP